MRSRIVFAMLLALALVLPDAGNLDENRTPVRTATAMPLDQGALARAHPLLLTAVGRLVPLRTLLPPGDPPAIADGFRHQWPGVYATANFEGETLIAAFDDDLNRYRIVFDDGSTHVVVRPGRQAFRFDHLGAGPHWARIEKLSESLSGTGAFVGFLVPPGGGALAPPAPRPRQIEFIGDSDTSGYGIASRRRNCTGQEVFLTTDTQRTYGPQVARRFDADYQINAYSGIGMVRNFGGANPGRAMTRLYARRTFADPTPYEAADWTPQIIVLLIGSNDVTPPVGPGERWSDQGDLLLDLERRYARFLLRLRDRNPRAFLLVAVLDGYDEAYEGAIRAVVAGLKREGAPDLDLIAFPSLERRGCHWHPSLKDHATMAEVLSSYIDARPDLWQGRQGSGP